MNPWLTGALLLALSQTSLASITQAPRSKSELCRLAKSPRNYADLLDDSSNLNSNSNYGGLANGGVCWWHSRLQRYSVYNAYYSPEKQRPTDDQAKEILKAIRNSKGFVEIPGYRNFAEFTSAHSQVVQKFLNKWQVDDGVFGFGFFKGTKDASDKVNAASLKERMDLLYSQVQVDGRIEYQMLQFPGFESHAWLVYKMEKTGSGYNLGIIDSNYSQEPQTVRYSNGDSALQTSYGPMKTFTGSTADLDKVDKNYAKECGAKLWKNKAQSEDKILAKYRKQFEDKGDD